MAQSARQHYLFLSSTDSLNYFPGNTPTDFTIELPERILFQGDWELSLVEIFFAKKTQGTLLVLCDLCENSFINDTKLPVIRVIQNGFFRQNNAFEQLISIPVAQSDVQRIRIYLRTPEGLIPSFIQEPVRCTLVLNRLS